MDEYITIAAVGYIFFFACSWYFLKKYQYDLNALYKGRYLLYQELIVSTVHTESSLLMCYPTSKDIRFAASCIFLISQATFFITYFLFLYRAILLNRLEFGTCESSDYPMIYAKLKKWWNIKVTIIFTLIESIPYVLIFVLYSPAEAQYEFFNLHSKNLVIKAGTYFYYSLSFLENICFCALFCYTLRLKFRLTIKIDLLLSILVWAAYIANRVTQHSVVNYSIFLPFRNLSLHMIVIISSRIRHRFVAIPDPPLYHEPYYFLYEHRIFYNTLHEFLETFEEKQYLECLELGLYINMYKFQNKQRYLCFINTVCERNKLPKLNDANFIDTEVFVQTKIESIFPDFFNSVFYERLSDALSTHSKAIYL